MRWRFLWQFLWLVLILFWGGVVVYYWGDDARPAWVSDFRDGWILLLMASGVVGLVRARRRRASTADVLAGSALGEQQGRGPRYVIGGGAVILIAIGIPLYAEFHVPGNMAWNIVLLLFLTGVAVAGFRLQRYFFDHPGEVGEARFDTRNKGDANG